MTPWFTVSLDSTSRSTGYPPIYFFDGWTFSIEDMAKLGIENVTYNGEGTYPDRREALVRHVKIFKVP